MQTIRRSWHRLPLAARRAMPCVAILIAASAALAQPYVYVANLGSDDISVLDTGTGSVVKTLPGGDDPNGVAVSSDGRQAFVTNFAGGTLSIIDTASNTIGMAVPVGNGPVGVAIATDGRTAYVANRGDDTVAVVDTTSGAVLAAVPVGDGPNAVAIAPDGRTAYVTNSFAKFPGAVSVLDLASRTVRDTVVVDRVPNRVAVSRDGTRAYVSHFRDWNLSVIDTATDAVIETLRISRQPSSVAVSPNGAYVYVTGRGYADETDGNVQIVETATDRVTGSLLAGLDPRAIAINRRGDVGYSADFGNNTVTALDLADEAVLGEIPVGDRPFALAVNCIGSECTAPAYTPKPTKTVTSTPTVPTPTATATFTPTATITTTPTRTATLRPGLEHVVIEISGAQAAPGGRVPIEVVLHTGGQVVYGVTHDIDFNNFVGVVARAPGVPACALDASVDGSAAFEFLPSPFNPSCSVDCAGLHVAIEASTPLLDGAVLYRCAIQVASFAPIGTQRLTNDGVGASGPHGEVLATRGLDGIISVVSGPTPPPEVLLRLSDIRGRPGERVTLEVHLDTHGHAVAGTQNDIEFAPYIGIAASRDGSPDCTVNPAIGKAATAFAFEPPGCSGSACTALRALVLSLVDTDPIADGALLYTCQIDIPPDVEPGTFAFRSSNLDASTPDGGAIPTGATGGSITVPGTSFHQQTTAEPPCTDASCITVEGICDGGDDDGLLCDCPGGTCVRQPACSSDPERGTCRGGARDAQCCDRSLNCGGGAACAGTTLVCGSGPSKGIPCLDDHQCIGAACVEGNGRCNAGAFRGSTCIDDRDCPLGACVKLDSSGPRIMPGFPCTRDEDCETGVCDTFDLICCNRACNADERCSGDGTCVAFDFTPSPATPTASQPQTPTSTRLPTLPTANPCGACPNGTDCNKGDPPLCVETRSGGGCSIAANPATDDLAVAALLPVALWLTRCWQLRLRRTRMRRRRPHP